MSRLRSYYKDFFDKSGFFSWKKLNHTPVILYYNEELQVFSKIVDVLNTIPDDVECIAQWKGEWNSDYFRFTVGQMKSYLLYEPCDYLSSDIQKWIDCNKIEKGHYVSKDENLSNDDKGMEMDNETYNDQCSKKLAQVYKIILESSSDKENNV